MLKKIKEFFEGSGTLDVDVSGKPTSEDLQIAMGVLLLSTAGTDDDYAPEEVKTIFSVMEKQFGLKDTKVLEILEMADKHRNETGKVDEFVKSINLNFDVKQRQIILAMIWKVVLADGKLEKEEQRLATQMRFRLQLSEEQARQAREMVSAGKV